GSGFRESHPEYEDYYRMVYDESGLLDLINSLAAKGIFPERNGWYRNGEEGLLGDFSKYRKKLDGLNDPIPGKRGDKQSKLLKRLNGMRNKTFSRPEISKKGDIKDGKKVETRIMFEAFREDREDLIAFVHDLYYEYMSYALGRNYLNFSFQLMFAFVLLMEDDELRESRQFKYAMIDEFQDTNEIQFKLSLLLSGTGNIAVVGDWKQSIFSFQYASVKNILNFEKRLEKYHRQINSDKRRTPYDPGDIHEISLDRNYRSSQDILDFSEGALHTRGKKDEEVQINRDLTSLRAAKEKANTEITAFTSEEEVDAVLEKLVELVESKEYRIDGEGVDYADVAIFSRNRVFARELDKRAREEDIPVSYEGGAEIFKTDPGVILLAWLRVLVSGDSDRGWSVILDQAGYNMEEVRYILNSGDYPGNVLAFRDKLDEAHGISTIARTVFQRYGFDNPFTDKIIEVLQGVFDSSFMNLGAVVSFIEKNVERGETYEVDGEMENAATVQTIHAAKGLEYPVVFLANMNSGVFPSFTSNSKRVYYDDLLGLRARKTYSEEEGYLYDNLNTYLASKVSGVDYDEERRLLYVALTRAENYLFLSAEQGKEGQFFKELNVESEVTEPDLERLEADAEEPAREELNVGEPEGTRPIKRAVHSVIDIPSDGFPEGRGTEFGTMIHEFAEKLARGEKLEPPFEGRGSEDKENLFGFITSLEGDFYPEQEVLVPRHEGNRKYVYHGSIDLLNVMEDRVEVIDYKTDLDKTLQGEYEKQLELYREAAANSFPEKDVTGIIFYTKEGERVEV
ncbi:UvrD-helicase domain-containing protein, partial [Candidatus Bipolaricaulota bacterium]|nr:UvrD-helicase domain-containing protein [Candidatus Bipolaricaulota bacterium]